MSDLRITRENARFQQWEAMLTNRTKRHRNREFLVQGVRPITRAVEEGWTVRALLRDRFPVVEHLAGSDVPVTVIYGGRDSVVPTQLSALVADRAPSLVDRVVLPEADHNDPVMFGPPVADAVARLAVRQRPR